MSALDDELARARKALRAELRRRRRALPPETRARAAERIAEHVQRRYAMHPGQHVALYSPLPEEVAVAPIAALARRHGCHLYVPRLTDRRRCRMRFVELGGTLRRNRLGILEPTGTRARPARWLDLVFVPLVGFDTSGMRLGMGAGYYDRAFAYLRLRRFWRKPHLIGVAYALQRVDAIACAAHDVRLDAIVTEEGVVECPTGC